MAYMDSYYVLSLNILKALGGDTSIVYPDADAIWDEINKIYNNAGNRFDIVPLEKNITENGQYDYYPDGDADAFMPVNINVNVPQKYTDEQVFEIESNAIQQGYNQGYVEGEAEGKLTGREEGYTDGYNTGYGTGVTDGGEAQKAKLVDITITENGVYTKDDGYKTVTVEIETGIPEEELQQMLQEAMDEGYQDGYSEGVDDGREEQKQELESVTFRENGTYTREDGWNSVTVEVAGSGGEGSLYDFTTALGVNASTNALLNDTITENVNYTKSLEASYVKPTTQSLNNKYYENRNIVYGPTIDTSGITLFGSNTPISSSSSNYGTFGYCSNMIYMPNFDTSSATNFSGTFYMCTKLKKIDGELDLSNVVNLYNSFGCCVNLSNIPFSGSIDKLTYARGAFNNCWKITSVPKINTSKCENLLNLFTNCNNLTTPIELDLSSCTTLCNSNSSYINSDYSSSFYNGVFYRCIKVPSIKLLNINSAVVDWSYAFYGCNDLTNLEMTFKDGFAPTTTQYMFYNCQNLEEIPWFDTSKITNAQYMFYNCYKLKRIPNCDFSSCTGSRYPEFYNCRELEEFGGDLILSKCSSVHGNMFTNVSCPLPNIYIEAATSMSDWLRYYKGTTVGNVISPKVSFIGLGMSKVNSGSGGFNIETIGTIDASSATGIGMFSDYTTDNYPALKNLGGFINYGKMSNASSITSYTAGLSPCNNLTRDSLMNIINNLYDRATAGYSVLTIKIHPDALARLTEDDIAIATNKGWTIAK